MSCVSSVIKKMKFDENVLDETLTGEIVNVVEQDTSSENHATDNVTTPTNTVLTSRRKLSFKNPKFSFIETGGRKFIWKSLKQIVTQEKLMIGDGDFLNYFSLNAPPSLRPPKKYSDLSGMEAHYTDPQTKLHFHNAEEFRIIRTLPSDLVQGYLTLRGATNIVG